MRVQDLPGIDRFTVAISVNHDGRVCIINPPPVLACVLSEASNGIAIIGRANERDYFVEASCEAHTFEPIARKLHKRLSNLMDTKR